MGKINRKCIVFIAVILFVIETSKAGITTLDREARSTQPFPRKRPFCNAFTGCGRKRSDTPAKTLHHRAGTTQEEYSNDLQDIDNTALDFNTEPAVEELMRQIMSETKLWEAIQEAGQEIDLQKQHSMTRNNYPISFSAQ